MSRRWWFEKLYLLGRPPWEHGVSPPELLAFVQRYPPGRALDLGCGTGTHLLTLARHGWEVVGVDFSRVALWRAARRLRRTGVSARLVYADVSRPLPLEGPFDLVLDIGCYHGLPPVARVGYRENLARLLAPGGHLLLYAHWREAAAPPDAGPPGVTAEDLAALLALGLRLEQEQRGADRGRPAGWWLFARPAGEAPRRVEV